MKDWGWKIKRGGLVMLKEGDGQPGYGSQKSGTADERD